jgi:hypothetical protein
LHINEQNPQQEKQTKTLNPGVGVKITVFCDFSPFFWQKNGVFLKNQCYYMYQFSAIFANFRRKNGAFLKNQCMIKFLEKLAVV